MVITLFIAICSKTPVGVQTKYSVDMQEVNKCYWKNVSRKVGCQATVVNTDVPANITFVYRDLLALTSKSKLFHISLSLSLSMIVY